VNVQVRHVVANHGSVHMLCVGCLTQSPAGLGAPPAHRPRFCAGQVGKARCVPTGFYEEMSQVDRAAAAAWRDRCEVGDDNQLVLADRASGQERSLLPVLAADKALRCGGAMGHGRYPRIPGSGRLVRIAAGSSGAGIAESFSGVLTAAGMHCEGAGARVLPREPASVVAGDEGALDRGADLPVVPDRAVSWNGMVRSMARAVWLRACPAAKICLLSSIPTNGHDLTRAGSAGR